MKPLLSINPATGEINNEYIQMSTDEINKCLKDVDSAYGQWKNIPFDKRETFLKKAAEFLRKNKSEYGRLMAREMGKPIVQGEAEIEKCAWVCEYYAENGHSFLKLKPVKTDAKNSYVAFKPLGVLLAVMPWNFPFWQVFRFAVPALMAGNVVILKHASNVQGCASAIESIFINAGFPENVLRNLVIRSNRVESIIENSIIKAVTITGSTLAGKSVAKKSGEMLKKTVLELGGSDPYIILEDSNLPQAVGACTQGRLLNTGQSCIAAKRFIVIEKILEQFIRLMKKSMGSKSVGDPLKYETEIGPMVSMSARDDLHRQVERSVKMGAKCLLGGYLPKGPGAFYPATLLSNVKPGMPAFDEELFGPVGAIISASNENEAIDLANQSSFGLGAAVFTQDMERGQCIAENELEAGTVFVNDFVKSDPRLPFGGVKDSGYGRELSSFGIYEFINIKTIYIK